jgi:hypothetical protein
MFTYTWAVTIESDVELSEDVVNVISDLKEDFADAVDTVLDIEDEFNHLDALANEIVPVEQNGDEQGVESHGVDAQNGQGSDEPPVYDLSWF